MNPLLEKKFEQIEKQLEALSEVLESSHQDVVKQHEEKEDLLQEKWRERKRVTTLNRIADDYDGLDSENQRFSEERRALKERLAAVLKAVKALREVHKAS